MDSGLKVRFCTNETHNTSERGSAEAVCDGLLHLRCDVGGAQRCGMRGLQVRTGKYRPSDEQHPSVRADAYMHNLAAAVLTDH